MSSESRVTALVLAAGYGRRFGSDKRRARLEEGATLLGTTLLRLAPFFAGVAVVIRPADDPAALEIPAGVTVIRTGAEGALEDGAGERGTVAGMGDTLAAGAAWLSPRCESVALAVALGDMAWVSGTTLSRLTAAAGDERIVRPVSRDAGQGSLRFGHPILFGRRFWPELAALSGDAGGRALLKRHPHACLDVAVADEGIHADADCPESLLAHERAFGGRP